MAGIMSSRNISKSPTLRTADDLYKSAVVRVTVLERLVRGDDYGTVIVDEKFMTQPHLDRVISQWFLEAPPGYWPHHELKAGIVAGGHRKALELSLNLPSVGPSTPEQVEAKKNEIGDNASYGKPIVSYWLCAGSHFQSVVAESDQQITLLLLTPSFPNNVLPDKPVTKHENIWLVSNARDAQKLIQAASFKGEGNEDLGHTVPKSEDEVITGVCVTPIYGEKDGAFDN